MILKMIKTDLYNIIIKNRIRRINLILGFTFLILISNNATANEIIFETDFEDLNQLSSWKSIGNNAYKKVEVFKNLPGSGSPDNFITVCNKTDIDNYHSAYIEDVERDNSITKALYLSTRKKDYPNRWSANIVPDSSHPWKEYYQEWKVKYSNSFMTMLGSGATYNSQHTIMHDNLQTIVLQLYGRDNGVYTRFQLYDEATACSRKEENLLVV